MNTVSFKEFQKLDPPLHKPACRQGGATEGQVFELGL